VSLCSCCTAYPIFCGDWFVTHVFPLYSWPCPMTWAVNSMPLSLWSITGEPRRGKISMSCTATSAGRLLLSDRRTKKWDGPDTFYRDLFVVVPWHGLHINEISLSSWCKLFPRNSANNHALCRRSLPLFLTFFTRRIKEPQSVVADVGTFTLCLLNHHAWRHQMSAVKVAPASYFHDHNITYDTVPWVVFRIERLSIIMNHSYTAARYTDKFTV